MGKMTISDIAEKAGVAKSTVSRVINGSCNVKETTRQAVLQIIKETGYEPSEVARGLSNNASNTIGVIIPSSAGSFFGQILDGISDEAEKNGCTVLYSNTNNDWNRERQAIQKMRSQQTRGLIITSSVGYSAPSAKKEFLQEIRKLDCSTVLLDRKIEHSCCNGVFFDNYNGAYISVEAMIRNHHKKIGGIISDLQLDIGQQRLIGFQQALEDNDTKVYADCTFCSDVPITMEQAYKISSTWLKKGNLPDAVFLSNSMIAKGFLKMMFENNLVPGKDIECFGFDAIDILDILKINYNYINRDAFNMGKLATQMLFDQERKGTIEHVIPANLVTV